MKTTIILASLLLFLAKTSISQVMAFRTPFVNVGVKIGGNLEQISSAPLKSSIGPLVGVYAKKGLGKFGLRLEAMASMAQYVTKYPAAYYHIHTPGMDTTTTGNFQVIYVNVPLMLEYTALPKLHLLAGLQYSYIASITDQNKVYESLYGNSDILTKTDFSIVAGVEFPVKGKIEIGARVVKGVIDVNNSIYYLTHKPWTSTGAQVSVSYKIM